MGKLCSNFRAFAMIVLMVWGRRQYLTNAQICCFIFQSCWVPDWGTVCPSGLPMATLQWIWVVEELFVSYLSTYCCSTFARKKGKEAEAVACFVLSVICLLLTLFCLNRLTLFGISYQQIIWIQILWKEEELVWKTSCYVWLHILFFAKTKSFIHF